jgi:hypothetical protein
MSKYNTNLASEFHVLSILHRLGLDALITLGNKKMVDIVITNKKGGFTTIDVKGIAKKYDWPADNIRISKNGSHFLVLVSYEGRIEEPAFMPTVWIIPQEEIEGFIKQFRTRKNISRTLIMKNGERFRNAWDLLTTQ